MRNRLLVSVVVCALTVVGAGVPTILSASDDVTQSQTLVDDADLNQQAIALSHALADERDGMVEYVAAGRSSRNGAGVSESLRARVDRQAADVRRADAPATVERLLKELPKTRQQALSGHGTALDVYDSYTETIEALQRVSAGLARALPGRAQSATADALPDLGRAVGQASATRGLLRAALAGPGPRSELTTQAGQAYVREQSAYADFDETAGTHARDVYARTVTGTDVTLAEKYLARLTDHPYLDVRDRSLNQERVETALSARIDRMRSVQASFAAHEEQRLETLRDDDVTSLELQIALVAALVLVAVGVSVSTARSITRPLSVLTRGSRRLAGDPATEEPVQFRGRNDEFAEVVQALNQLRETAAGLHHRAAEAEADNGYLVGTKDSLGAERDRLRAEYDALKDQLEAALRALREQEQRERDREWAAREEAAQAVQVPDDQAPGEEAAEPAPVAEHRTFVSLALRTLGLIERQLGVIEGLEEKETDPDRLGTLFKLDHLATRMRRHSENLLLLAGHEHGSAHHAGPVPLLDVLRAAVSEIEGYERAELGTLPPHVQLAGHAADDVSHLVAELLDNAAAFSPPETQVQLSGWLLENGDAVLSVQDDGIGVTGGRLAALNARLQTCGAHEPPGADDPYGELGMGLYVVARLAARHGLRVELREQQQGGVAAVVTVPKALLPARPAPHIAPPSTTGTHTLPGSAAEANSNALPTRRRTDGPAPRAVPPPAPEPQPEPQEAPRDAPAPADAAAGEPVTLPAQREEGDPLVAAAERAIQDAGEHAPAQDADHADEGGQEHEWEDERETDAVPPTPRVTDKGLPKRTPQQVDAQTGPARPRKQGTNAEELRRRLGGFQQGAQHGRRDAAAEFVAEENGNDQSGAQSDGGTAEEART